MRGVKASFNTKPSLFVATERSSLGGSFDDADFGRKDQVLHRSNNEMAPKVDSAQQDREAGLNHRSVIARRGVLLF